MADERLGGDRLTLRMGSPFVQCSYRTGGASGTDDRLLYLLGSPLPQRGGDQFGVLGYA
jgi:hypothetical protein